MMIRDIDERIEEIRKELKLVKSNREKENRLLDALEFYEAMRTRLEMDDLLDS